MNRVQREKAGWKFMTKAGARKGRWRLPRNRRPPATAPAEDESYREAGDMERGPEPPPSVPNAED